MADRSSEKGSWRGPAAAEHVTVVETQGTRNWTYDTAARLGAGGFGVVYAGSADDGSPVAVKIVTLSGTGPLVTQRRREIRIASSLGEDPGPNLMPYLDAIEDADRVVLVMPLATASLTGRLGDVSLEEATDIVDSLLVGLESLHAVGFLHRDIKPANVLMVHGKWVLSDYSLARDTTQATDTHTLAGLGTDPYMAPEVWRREPTSERTDLYSLGCLAHELAAGHPPFTGSDVDRKHLNATPPPLPEEFQGNYQRLVTRLLAKHQQARPATAAAARNWLRAAEDDAVTRALEAIAQSRDTAQNAELARRQLAEDRAMAVSDAIAGLHAVVAETAAALRRLDPAADSKPTHGATGSIELLGAGRTLKFDLWPLERRLGVPSTAVVAAGVMRTGRTGLIANLLYITSDTRAEWQLYQFQEAPPHGIQPWDAPPRGLRLEEFLQAVFARPSAEAKEERLPPKALTVTSILELAVMEEDHWQ